MAWTLLYARHSCLYHIRHFPSSQICDFTIDVFLISCAFSLRSMHMDLLPQECRVLSLLFSLNLPVANLAALCLSLQTLASTNSCSSNILFPIRLHLAAGTTDTVSICFKDDLPSPPVGFYMWNVSHKLQILDLLIPG